MAAGTTSGITSKSSIPPGTRVCCTICNGEKIEGEVLVFDINQKIFVLKLPSSSGSKGTCNINFINTDLLLEFSIVEETKKTQGPLNAIDMNKIHQRIESNLMARQRAAERVGVGVSSLAQKLFDTIHKQYSNSLWDSTKISVMDVTISPPYKPENCTGSTKSIDQIKKIVEKFHAEQSAPPSQIK